MRTPRRNSWSSVVPEPRASCCAPTSWLQSLDANWPRAVCDRLQRHSSAVRVLVTELRGSVPREPGACMLVNENDIQGTIGGGRLEWQAIQSARVMICDGASPAVQIQKFVLGVELGQCCGGVVQLWLERFTRTDLPLLREVAKAVDEGSAVFVETTLSAAGVVRRLDGDCEWATAAAPHPRFVRSAGEGQRVELHQASEHDAVLLERIDAAAPRLWIYGAGHVGQALVRTLAPLTLRTTLIDSRAELVPADLPENTRPLIAEDTVRTVSQAQSGTHFLVMTHDHALDFALCRAILLRGDFAWAGLIGSSSKAARFRSRLLRADVPADAVARLISPIGIAGVNSKQPAAIAIAVAAQLLQQFTAGGAASRKGSSGRLGGICDEHCASCQGKGTR